MARPCPAHGGPSRDRFHHRPFLPANTPFYHEHRSWSENGVAVGAISGNANGLLNTFFWTDERAILPQASNSRGFSNSVLGTAFHLLGTVSDMRQSTHPRGPYVGNGTRQVRIQEVEDDGILQEEDLAYGELNPPPRNTGRRPRSVFARFKDKLTEKGTRPKKTPNHHEGSPTRRPQSSPKVSFKTEFRERRRTQSPPQPDPEKYDSTDYEAYDRRPPRPRARRASSGQPNSIEALQNTMAYHKSQVRQYRKRLEEASGQQMHDTTYLQHLLNELKMHEQSLAASSRYLQKEETNLPSAGTRRPASHLPASHQSRPQPQRPRPRSGAVQEDCDGLFGTSDFDSSAGRPRSTQPLFAELHDFHEPDLFHDPMSGGGNSHSGFGGPAGIFADDVHHFFAAPGAAPPGTQRKRPRYVYVNGGAQPPHQAQPTFTAAPPPRPPPTLMTANEAKRLFKMYEDQWSDLSSTNPDIPYPTRGLHAPALLSRETLWAPNVSSHPAAWSEDAVMQANAQLFFLNVVDLVPYYTEPGGPGKVAMGYDKTKATRGQVQQLANILKKEKTRWHSDRLGRRNGGKPGPNEALQNDPRSRAVFHAVCELMETSQ